MMNYMRLKINLHNLIMSFSIILLFLAETNFYNQYYYLCFASCLLIIFGQKTFKIDIMSLMLLVLGVSWLIFSTTQLDSVTNAVKPFLYFLAYLAGKIYLNYKNKSTVFIEKKTISMIIMLAMGPFVHYVLNLFYNINATTRNTLDIWTREPLSATSQAAMCCLGIGVSTAILLSDEKIIYKVFSLISLGIVLLYNLILAGRSIFMIILICFAGLSIFIYFSKGKASFAKRIILFGVLLGTIIYLIFAYNIFGLKDLIYSSNFFDRFFSSTAVEAIGDDARWEMKINYIRSFIDGVFGGANLRNEYAFYAHDIFLDTYDEAGIFALIGLLWFVLGSVSRVLNIIKDPNIDLTARQIILGVHIALYSQFIVEPVLHGTPWLFTAFCFYQGALYNLEKTANSNKKMIM